MAGKPISLKATGLSSNEQGFSNCCFVHPSELSKLASAAGVDENDKAVKGAWPRLGARGGSSAEARALHALLSDSACW